MLAKTFDVESGYMPESGGGPDYYRESMLWSRRFVGLRLFLALATAGWDGVASKIENSRALCDRLVERMRSSGWRHVNNSPAAVACLLPPSGERAPDDIVRAVQASGRAWIAAVDYEGLRVVRVCITNARTSPDDIDALADLLDEAAAGGSPIPAGPE